VNTFSNFTTFLFFSGILIIVVIVDLRSLLLEYRLVYLVEVVICTLLIFFLNTVFCFLARLPSLSRVVIKRLLALRNCAILFLLKLVARVLRKWSCFCLVVLWINATAAICFMWFTFSISVRSLWLMMMVMMMVVVVMAVTGTISLDVPIIVSWPCLCLIRIKTVFSARVQLVVVQCIHIRLVNISFSILHISKWISHFISTEFVLWTFFFSDYSCQICNTITYCISESF